MVDRPPEGEGHSAPGAPTGGWRHPAVDERLAPPETRVEYLRGRELFAAPAREPRGTLHFRLTYVLRAHAAKGYRGAVDMLMRTDEASDFAPDASIFPADPDPRTGGRMLEELAFEVIDQQYILAVSPRERTARQGAEPRGMSTAADEAVWCVHDSGRQTSSSSTRGRGRQPPLTHSPPAFAFAAHERSGHAVQINVRTDPPPIAFCRVIGRGRAMRSQSRGVQVERAVDSRPQ